MSSPLEDQIWKYIAEHRTLKLIFLAATAIGVFSSTARTIEPALNWAVRLGTRYVVATPSPEVKAKYGCAYKTGLDYWTISRILAYMKKVDQLDLELANMTVREIRQCERAFDYTPALPDISLKSTDGTISTDESQGFSRSAASNFNEFQAHLATKDPLALTLLRLGSELESSRMTLIYLSRIEPAAFVRPLNGDLKDDIFVKLNRIHAEAKSQFPYKLPPLDLQGATARTLLQSIVAAQTRYLKYFSDDV